MKQNYFQTVFTALLDATEQIERKYFELPVSYEREIVFRERAYCYELYHQMRMLLPNDFPYTLCGEVNKAGHPSITPYCGLIIPDFLIHNPGHMGENDNLAIVEVKTIQGAGYMMEGKDLLKDIEVINCMTSIENGYYKGVLLIFGSSNDNRKREIENVFVTRCNPENILLLFHNNPLERAIRFNG